MESSKTKGRFLKAVISPIKSIGNFMAKVLATLILLGLMVCVIVISSIVFPLNLKNAAIALSSVISFFVAIPLTLIWFPVIRELIRKTDDNNQLAIEKLHTENQSLKNQLENQKTMEKNLNSKINLLENLVHKSQASVDILKVGYKETTKFDTVHIRKKFNEKTEASFLSSPSYDEAILILDCKAKYQRGIDFKKLRLNYQGSNKDAVVVTNLKPEYLMAPTFEYETFLSEIRHVETDKNGNIKKIHLQKDSNAQNLLRDVEDQCKKDYESSFHTDENLESVEETNEIMKISKDCIRLLLQPYFSKIEFDTFCEIKDSKPWLEFLQQRIEDYKTVESK